MDTNGTSDFIWRVQVRITCFLCTPNRRIAIRLKMCYTISVGLASFMQNDK